MRMRVLAILSAAVLALAFSSAAEARAILISQIYTSGGLDAGPSSPLNTDYLELFNASGSPVDLGGWVLAFDAHQAFQATTQPFICAGCTGTIPAGTVIEPCSYLLISLGPASTTEGRPLPIVPDVHLDTPTMAYGWFGAIALLTGGAPDGTCAPPTEEDLVGWNGTGTGTTFIRCFQGAAQPAHGPGTVLVRLGAGMTDTSNNANDFAAETVFNPHNKASSRNVTCVLQTPAEAGSWGRVKAIYR